MEQKGPKLLPLASIDHCMVLFLMHVLHYMPRKVNFHSDNDKLIDKFFGFLIELLLSQLNCVVVGLFYENVRRNV